MSNDHIFISYRREDSAGYARAIYEHLVKHFGKENIFMDVAAIEPGLPYDEVIDRAVGHCDVLLAIIGKQWMQQRPGLGPRIGDENDLVRLEISAALSRNIRVIPVLLDGTTMPSEGELPEPIRALSRRNAIEVRNGHFDSDMPRLVNVIGNVLGQRGVLKGKIGHLLDFRILRWLVAGFSIVAVTSVAAYFYVSAQDVCARLDGHAINIQLNDYLGVIGPDGIKLERLGLWEHRFITEMLFSTDLDKKTWGVLRDRVVGQCHSKTGTISFVRTLKKDDSVQRYSGKISKNKTGKTIMDGTFDSGYERGGSTRFQWIGWIVDLAGN